MLRTFPGPGSLDPLISSDLYLGGGFQYIFLHSYLGKISNVTHIFQMGWFNHQPDIFNDFAHLLWEDSLDLVFENQWVEDECPFEKAGLLRVEPLSF